MDANICLKDWSGHFVKVLKNLIPDVTSPDFSLSSLFVPILSHNCRILNYLSWPSLGPCCWLSLCLGVSLIGFQVASILTFIFSCAVATLWIWGSVLQGDWFLLLFILPPLYSILPKEAALTFYIALLPLVVADGPEDTSTEEIYMPVECRWSCFRSHE